MLKLCSIILLISGNVTISSKIFDKNHLQLRLNRLIFVAIGFNTKISNVLK